MATLCTYYDTTETDHMPSFVEVEAIRRATAATSPTQQWCM
jgi:hypothetical protein